MTSKQEGQTLYIFFVYVLFIAASFQLLLGSLHLKASTTDEGNVENHHELSVGHRRLDSDDQNCIFRDSPLYRSVFIYPSPGEPEWNELADIILSESGKSFSSSHRYPWQTIEERTRQNEEFHFRMRDARASQYTTELLVREILTNPESCLRTNDPETASLFYVPYMVSIEWHNGTQYPKSYRTSPYAQAIMDVVDHQDYDGWVKLWGYTSKYWERRQGADHILVMSEGCHGLTHPRSKAGNDVFIHAQKQMTPPIIIYKDTSKTFLNMYPNCAAKNIVVPAPNPDGRWFNGRVDQMAKMIAENASFGDSSASLPQDPLHRPLAYYYKAGNHGSCRRLRQRLEASFECSPTGRYLQQRRKLLPKGYHFPHALRHATFCPCPGGDTPNSKRNFDSILAGCIPLILSHDFVWPFSADVPGSRVLVQEAEFSIRLNTSDFLPQGGLTADDALPTGCASSSSSEPDGSTTIQSFIESMSSQEIDRLQRNLARVAGVYSYYQPSPTLPDNPLLSKVLPNGPAAHALVQELADRAYGNRWPACHQEIQIKDPLQDDVHQFQC